MVHLNSKQKKYLLKLDIPKRLKNILTKNDEIKDDDADELRDICIDRFDYYGLDENYNETDDGVILNELIDALYTGQQREKYEQKNRYNK